MTERQRAVVDTIKKLRANPYRPSLHTKKLKGESDVWQCRVDRGWRMTFLLNGNTAILLSVRAHEK